MPPNEAHSPVYSNVNTITFEKSWFKKCMKITVCAQFLTLNSGFVNICTIALSNGPPWHTFRQSFIFNPCLKSGGLKSDILVEISTTILWAITFYKNTEYKFYVPVLPSGSAAKWPGQCVYGVCFVILSYAFWKEKLLVCNFGPKNAYILRFLKMAAKAPLENWAKLRLFMREVT